MALDIRRPFPAAATIGAVVDRDLDGTYRGVAVEIRQDAGSDVECRHVVGTAEFDGGGNVSVDIIRRCSLEGTSHDVETGTYSVSPDGVAVFALGLGTAALCLSPTTTPAILPTRCSPFTASSRRFSEAGASFGDGRQHRAHPCGVRLPAVSRPKRALKDNR